MCIAQCITRWMWLCFMLERFLYHLAAIMKVNNCELDVRATRGPFCEERRVYDDECGDAGFAQKAGAETAAHFDGTGL